MVTLLMLVATVWAVILRGRQSGVAAILGDRPAHDRQGATPTVVKGRQFKYPVGGSEKRSLLV